LTKGCQKRTSDSQPKNSVPFIKIIRKAHFKRLKKNDSYVICPGKTAERSI